MKFQAILLLFALTSCVYAPKQDFIPGTPLYFKANPKTILPEEKLFEQTTKHKILIGIIDSGVDYNHPHIQRHVRINHQSKGVGYDLLGSDGYPFPNILDRASGEEIEDILGVNQHGTHVASLALLGGELLLPGEQEKVDIGPLLGMVPIRAIPLSNEDLMDENDSSLSKEENSRVLAKAITEVLVQSIQFAINEGVHIVNMSLGVEAKKLHENVQPIFEQLIRENLVPMIRDDGRDVLFVSAAGNESNEVVAGLYPAAFNFDNTLTIGALDNSTTIANYSNYGHLVDVYIRGTEVVGLLPDGNRGPMTGTSMASPLVANIAAKMKLLAPCMTAADLKRGIISTAEEQTMAVGEEKNDEKPSVIYRKVKVASFKRALQFASNFCRKY